MNFVAATNASMPFKSYLLKIASIVYEGESQV